MEQKQKRLLLLKLFIAVAQFFTSVNSNSLYTTDREESGTPGIATVNLFKNARTSPAQSPSVVSFQRFISNNRHWDHGCQGTVINETHVVTTALCATWDGLGGLWGPGIFNDKGWRLRGPRRAKGPRAPVYVMYKELGAHRALPEIAYGQSVPDTRITRSGYFFGEALVGAWNLSDINELGMQRRWLKDVTLFPGWHGKEIFQTFPDELKNNIALVRLEIPVALNDRIQPLRLASQESDPLVKLTNCSTTVWNWKEYLPGSVGGSPLIRMDTLHKIQLRIISNEECSQRVQKYSTGISIDADSMICAMALFDKQQTNSFCPFEEGAALICDGDEEDQGPYLAGVASFGNLNKCDVNAVVYTRISHYLKFIEVTIAVIEVSSKQKTVIDVETRATPLSLDKGDVQPFYPNMGQDGLKVTLKTISGKVEGYYSYGSGQTPDALKHDGILIEGVKIIPQTSCNPQTKISLAIHGVHSPNSRVQYENEPAKLPNPPPCVTTINASSTPSTAAIAIKPITPTTSSPIISISATQSSDSGTDLTVTPSAPSTTDTKPVSGFGIEVHKDPGAEYDSAGEGGKSCRTKKVVVCLTLVWTTYYL